MSNIPKRVKDVQREYLSPKEAGVMTGLAAYTWRRYALEGRIASTKFGRKVLIPVSEIRRVMSKGYRPALVEQ
jgi:excisionase family DNA binding protein